MYKCLFKKVKNDVYDFDHVDLISYITMVRKIVEDHENSLISRTDRNIQKWKV